MEESRTTLLHNNENLSNQTLPTLVLTRRGIKNKNNNCYINVIRQLLCSCPSFMEAVMRQTHSQECKKKRQTDLCQEAWDSLCTYCQLEATGLALLTMSWDILSDFVEINVPGMMETVKEGHMEDAYCFWNAYLSFSEHHNFLRNEPRPNRSLFNDMFRGMESTWISCRVCNTNEQQKIKIFGFSFSLPTEAKTKIDLRDIIQNHMKATLFEHSCNGMATQTFRFLALPKNIVFRVNRISQHLTSFGKTISIPKELDHTYFLKSEESINQEYITEEEKLWITNDQKQLTTYSDFNRKWLLTAVIVYHLHKPTRNSEAGHYTIYSRLPTGDWIYIDDHKIERTVEEKAIHASGFMYCYSEIESFESTYNLIVLLNGINNCCKMTPTSVF